jgi:hypothetical protein
MAPFLFSGAGLAVSPVLTSRFAYNRRASRRSPSGAGAYVSGSLTGEEAGCGRRHGDRSGCRDRGRGRWYDRRAALLQLLRLPFRWHDIVEKIHSYFSI